MKLRTYCILMASMSLLASCGRELEAEDRTANYNDVSHTLRTVKGKYKIYFPHKPDAIVGQRHITHVTNEIGGTQATYTDQCADFTCKAEGLRLTIRSWIDNERKNDTDWIQKLAKEIIQKAALRETSSKPVTSRSGHHGVELAGHIDGGTWLRSRILITDRTPLNYLLVAEGEESKVNGADASRFFDSFQYTDAGTETAVEQTQFISKQEWLTNLFGGGRKPAPHIVRGSKLATAITQYGLSNGAVIAKVAQEEFASPVTDRAAFPLVQCCDDLEGLLGDGYRVRVRSGTPFAFGEYHHAQNQIDIESTSPFGRALSVFLDGSGVYVSSMIHVPTSAIGAAVANPILKFGLGSNEVYQAVATAFSQPVSGVGLQDLIDDIKQKLGPEYIIQTIDGNSFPKPDTQKRPDAICLQFVKQNASGALFVLLDSRGQLVEYYADGFQ